MCLRNVLPIWSGLVAIAGAHFIVGTGWLPLLYDTQLAMELGRSSAAYSISFKKRYTFYVLRISAGVHKISFGYIEGKNTAHQKDT